MHANTEVLGVARLRKFFMVSTASLYLVLLFGAVCSGAPLWKDPACSAAAAAQAREMQLADKQASGPACPDA